MPADGIYVLIARVSTVYYFGFFALMPIWTKLGDSIIIENTSGAIPKVASDALNPIVSIAARVELLVY